MSSLIRTLFPYLKQRGMKVCVVGCGAAGIISGKYLIANNFNVDIYEMTEQIGGTWIYSEEIYDSKGAPIHSSMYYNLKTNLPKELMEFEGLRFQNAISFVTRDAVLKYLEEFAEKYGVTSRVKFCHKVKSITKEDGGLWKVVIDNLESNEQLVRTYDSVMVCNGHYSLPNYPDLEGLNEFQGFKLHSKFYKKPEMCRDKSILIIGFGPSGIDIASDISTTAKKVYVSHHTELFKQCGFKSNVVSKPDIKCFNKNGAIFQDDSIEELDGVIFCTGYYYSFPFLDKSCGLKVENNYVSPLYKQFVNIEHPTMAVIGLTFRTFIFPLFEVQVRSFISLLLGNACLPTKEVMLNDLKMFECEQVRKKKPKNKFHQLSRLEDYVDDVASVGKVRGLPAVLYKIYYDCASHRADNQHTYRRLNYTIIDDIKFCVEYRTEEGRLVEYCK